MRRPAPDQSFPDPAHAHDPWRHVEGDEVRAVRRADPGFAYALLGRSHGPLLEAVAPGRHGRRIELDLQDIVADGTGERTVIGEGRLDRCAEELVLHDGGLPRRE